MPAFVRDPAPAPGVATHLSAFDGRGASAGPKNPKTSPVTLPAPMAGHPSGNRPPREQPPQILQTARDRETAGQHIARRPNCDPRAVLGVQIVKVTATQAA